MLVPIHGSETQYTDTKSSSSVTHSSEVAATAGASVLI
jgi:hypothetical protein